MKRVLWWLGVFLIGWELVGVYFWYTNPQLAKPILRAGYVQLWQWSKAWGLDPCRSCPIPDRFK